MRVLALLSGGVDSTVAAALLLEQGFHVTALTLALESPGPLEALGREAVAEAARVASALGIEHRVWDAGDAFRTRVVEPFVEDYLGGWTPNPCVLCNPEVKIRVAWEAAEELGCEAVATGHYAQVGGPADSPELHRGVAATEQSYFLYRLVGDGLRGMVLPLGGMDKAEVRRRAQEMGLENWNRPDSQDVCFARGRPPTDLIAKVAPGRLEPGDIVDHEGRVLGRHRGLAYYTVGQRRGLRIGGGPALYVVRLDPEGNRVFVGPHEDLETRQLLLRDCVWDRGMLEREKGLSVVVRYRATAVECEVRRLPGSQAQVTLTSPVWGAAPGQSAVVYDGDRVLGGGVICSEGPGADDRARRFT